MDNFFLTYYLISIRSLLLVAGDFSKLLQSAVLPKVLFNKRAMEESGNQKRKYTILGLDDVFRMLLKTKSIVRLFFPEWTLPIYSLEQIISTLLMSKIATF